jgi:hypothetical protein
MKKLCLSLCFVALAACGQIPQPFHESPKAITGSALLDTPTALGIAILPVKGAPAPFDTQIGEALAERFGALEIPAEAVPTNRGLGFTLQGEAQELETGPATTSIAIVWRLQSRRGALAADYRQTASLPTAAWREGGKTAASALAQEAAAKLTQIIAGDAPVNMATLPPPPKPKLPTVSIKPVEGAPGDGRESLRLAILQVLAENSVRRDDVQPDIVLNCTVTTTPFNASLQRVEIVWRATDRDGKDVGTVKLENTIPVGALDRAWGPTAFAIANAAGSDLLRLLASVMPAPVANPQQPRG